MTGPGQRVLYENGRILTGAALLASRPEPSEAMVAEALLVEDGLVRAVGSVRELRSLRRPGTHTVDLGGSFAMPGLNDAHLHLGEAARLAREVDLRGARSLDEALARIAAAARKAAPGAWLTGGGWDEHLWGTGELPVRGLLDRVTGDHPAVFARIDVHVSAANSAALRIAGVDRRTIAPAGSSLDHDDEGEPTGLLREQPARLLVERHVPPASQAEREQGIRDVLLQARALGITSVQDNSVDADVNALHALHAKGLLPIRVSEWLPFDAPVAELRERRQASPQDRWLRTTMLKAFLDGSLGSRTAALHAPYADEPSQRGLALYEQPQLSALARERAEAGFQLGFHAIGDRAFDMALEAFACSLQGSSTRARFRIEHAQLAAAAAFARAAALGVIASIQPCHLASDARWVRKRLGDGQADDRCGRAYAWRSFVEAGVPLALGTDLPVEPLDPCRNLATAITREAEDGSGSFYPGQALTVGEAIHAYTQGSAYAEHAESWKGRLAPGYVADWIVLDRDLFACRSDARALREARVWHTFTGG